MVCGRRSAPACQSWPCVCYQKESNLRLVVHGDDFTHTGFDKDLDWFRTQIKGRFEVKFRARIGPSESDDQSVRILNRIVEWM